MTRASQQRAATVGGAILIAALVIVVLVLDPVGHIVGAVGRPSLDWIPDLPHIPGWFAFLLGAGKLILIGVVVAVIAIAGAWHSRCDGRDA